MSTVQKDMHLHSSWIIKSHQTYFTIMLSMIVYKHLKKILNSVSSQLIDYSMHILTLTPWIIGQRLGNIQYGKQW